MFKRTLAAFLVACTFVGLGALDRADAVPVTNTPHVKASWPNKSKVIYDIKQGTPIGWGVKSVVRQFATVRSLPNIKRFGNCRLDTRGALCIKISARHMGESGPYFRYAIGAGFGAIRLNSDYVPNGALTCRAVWVDYGGRYHRRKPGCGRVQGFVRKLSDAEKRALQRAYP